jgi:uncharacterized protein (TIGR02594 family)
MHFPTQPSLICVSAYDIAQRFVGIKEMSGTLDNPMILAMLKLDDEWPEHDEVPWCSGFANFVCMILRLPRSKSLRARSWLEVGRPVALEDAKCGFDVVIFNRGGPHDASVIDAPGHVAFFARLEGDNVYVLGGNQSNSVKVSPYPREDVLGVRRLYGV